MPYLDSTIRIIATITDFDKVTLLDPDTQVWRVYDPDGIEDPLSPFTPTKQSTGVYYVDFTIPADGKAGKWKLIAKIFKGTKRKTDVYTFDVSVP